VSMDEARARARELAAALERLDKEERLGELDRESIQRPLRWLVKAYLARKRAEHEANGVSDCTPFGDDRSVTATEVAVLCADMLDAVDMDSFELNMWRSLGRF